MNTPTNNKLNIVFDVNRSLKANPPHYDKEEGINHVKREGGSLSSLRTINSKGVSQQARQMTLEDDQRKIENSYRANGVLYDRQVMVAELCDDKGLDLISGYGRHYTLQEMGVDHYFYDIVKFESNYWREVWKARLNNTKDHNSQGTPPTEGSYLKTLTKMEEDNSFNAKDDDEVRLALFRSSNGQLTTKQIEKLLNKFRKGCSRYTTTVAMNKTDANRAAKKLGLPTSGYNEHKDTKAYGREGFHGRTGFVCRNGGNLVKEAMSWAVNYKQYGKPVELVAYTEHTNLDEEKIADQRKKFKGTIENIINDVIKSIFKEEYHNMVQFKGFLAQIQSPNPADEGRPMERGLVDVDGKMIYEMVDGKKVYPNKKKGALSVAA